MKIKKIFESYLEYSEFYKPKDTYKGEVSRFKNLLIGFETIGIFDTDELNDKIIMDLIKFFRNKGLKNSTINTRLIMLYAALKHFNIETKLSPRKTLKDDTISFTRIQDNDLYKILKYVYEIENYDHDLFYIKAAIFIFLETGVRMNELLNIKISNIDMNKQIILLDRTKNYKNRIVPFEKLTLSVITYLIDFNESSNYLFFDKKKNQLFTSKKISYWLKHIKNELGIESLHAHKFRKTFATNLYYNGCSLTTVMVLLGHQNPVTTKIYLDLNDNMILNDYKKHKIDY
ncbi:MAG: tyrosine-type recombinase/integrase [Acholeplasmataceae bacterium]